MEYKIISSTDFVKKLLTKLGAGYVYGTIWELCTIDVIKRCNTMYGSKMGVGYFESNGDFSKGLCAKWLNKMVCDCSGLLESSYNELTNSKLDYSADMFFKACINKNFKRPMVTGDAVFMRNNSGLMTHVGVYIGDGKVIESRGVKYGVVITNFKDRAWTNWGELPFVKYDIVETDPVILAVNKAVKVGCMSSPEYWIDVLNGVKPANNDYLLKLIQCFNTKL